LFESLKKKLSGTVGKITDKLSREEEEAQKSEVQEESGKIGTEKALKADKKKVKKADKKKAETDEKRTDKSDTAENQTIRRKSLIPRSQNRKNHK